MRDRTMDRITPLKLRARRAEDYEVVSALLQDALIPASEMDYLPEQRRFVVLANRFRWELSRDGPADTEPTANPESGGRGAVDASDDARFHDVDAHTHFQRTHCGLCFDRVKAVRRRGFKPGQSATLLNLLALTYDDGGITLEFSGGAAVRLVGRRIACHLEDLGESWPTKWRPSHAAVGLDDDSEAR